MSSVYITEPATSGRVIFETTHGPLDVQLWCRECPQTTRFFLQLCLDGFYDNMVFHRILGSFLIQTGAIREPAVPGEDTVEAVEKYRTAVNASRALERRRHEVHSRLRFNHRGQVAMALESGDNEDEDEQALHPQFFITLDEASNLDGKHVLFGTVTGPTMFNAIRIGQVDTNDDDRAHTPRILSSKIVDNRLHTDLVPQEVVPWRLKLPEAKRKKKKRKGKRDINVLSFGDELEEGEDDFRATSVKSSHDVLDSKHLSKAVDAKVKDAVSGVDEDDEAQGERMENRKAKKLKIQQPTEMEVVSSTVVQSEADGSAITEQAASTVTATEEAVSNNKEVLEVSSGVVRETAKEQPQHEAALESTTVSGKPVPHHKEAAESSDDDKAAHNKKSTGQEMENILEARRSKYVKGRKSKKERQHDTFEKLMAFRSKVRMGNTSESSSARHRSSSAGLASRMAQRLNENNEAQVGEARTYHGQVTEDSKAERGSDWLHTRFKCRRHMDLASREEATTGGDGRNMDDYKVVDEKRRSDDKLSRMKRSKKSSKRHKSPK